MRPVVTSPETTSSASKVICPRCTSKPTTIATGAPDLEGRVRARSFRRRPDSTPSRHLSRIGAHRVLVAGRRPRRSQRRILATYSRAVGESTQSCWRGRRVRMPPATVHRGIHLPEDARVDKAASARIEPADDARLGRVAITRRWQARLSLCRGAAEAGRDACCRTKGARRGSLRVPMGISEPEPTLDHLGRTGEESLPRKNVPGPAAPAATTSTPRRRKPLRSVRSGVWNGVLSPRLLTTTT